MRRLARKFGVNLAALTLVLSGLSLLSFALAPRPQPEGRDIERQRQEWFYRQRAYPHRYVPTGAHQRALEQLDQKVTAEEAARATSASGKNQILPGHSLAPRRLRRLIPTPIVSGRVTALAIHPSNVNTVYLGARRAASGRRQMAAHTWTPLTDSPSPRPPSVRLLSILRIPVRSMSEPAKKISAVIAITAPEYLNRLTAALIWTQFCGPILRARRTRWLLWRRGAHRRTGRSSHQWPDSARSRRGCCLKTASIAPPTAAILGRRSSPAIRPTQSCLIPTTAMLLMHLWVTLLVEALRASLNPRTAARPGRGKWDRRKCIESNQCRSHRTRHGAIQPHDAVRRNCQHQYR